MVAESWFATRRMCAPGDMDFLSAVTLGQVEGFKSQLKFGNNASVGATEEDVWSCGATQVQLASAEKMLLTSDSVQDDTGGTGAITIELLGFDSDSVAQSETMTLNGTANVESALSYLALPRMTVRTTGSTGANVGLITATSKGTSNIQACIAATFNQTTQAIDYIPAGYYGKLLKWTVSASRGDLVEFKLKFKQEGIWVVKDVKQVYENTITIPFDMDGLNAPTELVKITAKLITGTGTGSVTASWQMILVPQELVNP